MNIGLRSCEFLLAAMVGLAPALGGCGGSSPETAPAPNAKPEAPKAPLIQKVEVADWCKEHGVPESVCTRCNAKLIAGFQSMGDWCKEHELPESQCIACHPELEAKFAAMAPKTGG
jgi:cobalt-zinc-cadmium efflux system membrane fusion protein